MYKMIMDGVDTPFALRLFVTERGRKAWDGAREAIAKANRGMYERLFLVVCDGMGSCADFRRIEVDELGEKWKREQEMLKKKQKAT